MTMPIGLALLFLMAIAPGAAVAQGVRRDAAARRLLWPAWAGAGVASWSRSSLGARGFAPLLAFGLGGFAAGVGVAPDRAGHAAAGLAGLRRPDERRDDRPPRRGDDRRGVRGAAAATRPSARSGSSPVETARIAGHRITYLGTADSVEPQASLKKKARLRIDGGQVYAPAIQQFPNAHAAGRHAVGEEHASPRTCTSPCSTCPARPAARSSSGCSSSHW